MAQTPAKKIVTIRIDPQTLTEDEADFLFYLKHKADRRYTLDEVAKEFGYAVERPAVRKRTVFCTRLTARRALWTSSVRGTGKTPMGDFDDGG